MHSLVHFFNLKYLFQTSTFECFFLLQSHHWWCVCRLVNLQQKSDFFGPLEDHKPHLKGRFRSGQRTAVTGRDWSWMVPWSKRSEWLHCCPCKGLSQTSEGKSNVIKCFKWCFLVFSIVLCTVLLLLKFNQFFFNKCCIIFAAYD